MVAAWLCVRILRPRADRADQPCMPPFGGEGNAGRLHANNTQQGISLCTDRAAQSCTCEHMCEAAERKLIVILHLGQSALDARRAICVQQSRRSKLRG